MCSEMLDPFGIGTVVRCPVAFVIVMDVSSATLFGILCTGGNMRRVSYKTLYHRCVRAIQGRAAGGGTDAWQYVRAL